VRVLLVDYDGIGLDLAYRAVEAGHEVKWYMPPHKDKSPIRMGDGFEGIEKVTAWQPWMNWAKKGGGLIVNLYNDVKITTELDKFRDFGFPVFGPTVKSAELERNRGLGMKMIEKHGIEVPHFETFKTLDEAIDFAWKADQPYCFKPLGDEPDKALTYIAHDPADLVAWLEKQSENGLKLKGPCILQEKIDMICEVGIAGWMGKNGFLPGKFNVNFEYKKLMPGDYGPATGEMGTVCKYVEGGRLVDEILLPFEETLIELGHIGDTDIGCGIDSKGRIWPFEFSMRFGFPSTPIVVACHTCDPVEWMREAAVTGKDLLEVDNRTSIGVLMCRPPFPMSEDPEGNSGYVISGIEEVWDHVSPVGMMIGSGPVEGDSGLEKGMVYKTAGDCVCCVTALGADVHDIIPAVYETVKKIKYPDPIVRIGIGEDLEDKLPKVKIFGFDELPDW
jgi:phosphoribosylamine---glycine ligase